MFGTSIYDLTVASAKSVILRAGVVVSRALNIQAASTLRLNGYTLTGTNVDITNAGSMTLGSGTLIHKSSIVVTPSTGNVGTTFTVMLTDADANIDGTAADTVTVNTDGESLILQETGNATGVFSKTLPTAHSARIAGNGVVERDDACEYITGVTYVDPGDTSDTAVTTFTVTDTQVDGCISGSVRVPGSSGGHRDQTVSRYRSESISSNESSSVLPAETTTLNPCSSSSNVSKNSRISTLCRRLDVVEHAAMKNQQQISLTQKRVIQRLRKKIQDLLIRYQEH
jgi:hypothetical protein